MAALGWLTVDRHPRFISDLAGFWLASGQGAYRFRRFHTWRGASTPLDVEQMCFLPGQVYQSIARRRGKSVVIVAVARKLLVVVWHLLTRKVPYLYLNPVTFTHKLKAWARTIGQDDLITESTRSFVTHQLQVTNLEEAILAGT